MVRLRYLINHKQAAWGEIRDGDLEGRKDATFEVSDNRILVCMGTQVLHLAFLVAVGKIRLQGQLIHGVTQLGRGKV